ncbi:hypothetical protein RCZ15_26280 [Capnocytophaga catalasegens]|uniref:Uncharacterized protein n=1 Tax=Capnocytophaga catalasegens TaxID=1004260 RepID=A0AAV5B0S8_9FLAO|nr:hypothetical protein RCZ03_04130 [Capnocytophaga catalasegens]GJM51655.1 hypothetical protein RCZ15_26280 [Capnocytophaga catalasegens]GJM54271.1 hypothetical protein RCZ16_25870 [Capnocytophaga catalasegens]
MNNKKYPKLIEVNISIVRKGRYPHPMNPTYKNNIKNGIIAVFFFQKNKNALKIKLIGYKNLNTR